MSVTLRDQGGGPTEIRTRNYWVQTSRDAVITISPWTTLAESNRSERFCRPLPNRLAQRRDWCPLQESNLPVLVRSEKSSSRGRG